MAFQAAEQPEEDLLAVGAPFAERLEPGTRLAHQPVLQDGERGERAIVGEDPGPVGEGMGVLQARTGPIVAIRMWATTVRE